MKTRKKPRLGSGKRFKMLVAKLKMRGASSRPQDPEALAAWIGRKRYGKKKFSKLSRHSK
jgi:hypothetical protein